VFAKSGLKVSGERNDDGEKPNDCGDARGSVPGHGKKGDEMNKSEKNDDDGRMNENDDVTRTYDGGLMIFSPKMMRKSNLGKNGW
jgi:hypothetical protein